MRRILFFAYGVASHLLFLAVFVTMAGFVANLLPIGTALMTTYLLVAIPFEERDLVAVHGERYRAYRREVPALMPRLGLARRFTRQETSA